MKSIFLLLSIVICILGYFSYDFYYNEEIINKTLSEKDSKIELLNTENSNLKNENKDLKIKISDMEIKIKSFETLISEEKNKEDELKLYIANFNEELKLPELKINNNTIIKFSDMNIGEWNLTNEKKQLIMSTLKDEEPAVYEIIPIIDNNNYKNDNQGLKQIGLSRQRAATAAALIKSINPKNKVFISTEIITSENERGFIIKKTGF